MTNRKWLESLPDKELAILLGEYALCKLCIEGGFSGCNGSCIEGVRKWLETSWDYPTKKKELTDAQLYKTFETKFDDRRAISLEEIKETIRELFR